MELHFEQSDTEFYTPFAGLAFIGHALNKKTSLKKSLRKIKKRHGIANIDLVRAYVGLLALGKNDFDAIDTLRHDDWFQQCMGIKQMPSASRLRQRFNEDATQLIPLIEESLAELLIELDAPLTPLPKELDRQQHIPLDMDVTPQDNSNSKKEGVSWTYKHFFGYSPIMAYLGQEGWCMGCELRPGSQHSQNDFIPFLGAVLQRVRRITQQPILLRLDSAHDAEDTRMAVAQHANVDHIIKLNPRQQYTSKAWLPKFEAAKVEWHELRAGKHYATLTINHEAHYGHQRLIIKMVRRTSDAVGQMFLTPDYELEGWWTTLNEEEYSDNDVILLYENHATSEQFHSELKTDMDLERLPSGKFDTNDLVMCLGALTYNMLRYMGQSCLLGPQSPVRHQAARRRIKTVMQELIYQAARFLEAGRRKILRFGRYSPALQVFMGLYPEKMLC
ncbi:IS1380 family transposase [Endozoicomonas numazuensis]|uniref:Transposase n=1 Tax=Endozoicomonas numazuensis TaxID=1137799 RepID=A0A081NHD2_9GAMM|nr:IS1380 family transposase [Endozoicomonas numazuensis]KEQ13962.1 transposase [Endozoicomonas numazuensis]KEQ16981.1 transposase [Endozoicomonas numazuensis]KEQ17081.1 transposase [Endozoicomonas numazuensis]KEQ17088.1 transposase [Endozoicomonas numazuensis]KEQ17549.1 transposase [Endozoicomonas numazuensis]